MELGIIKGRTIEKNRDGDKDRIILQVEIIADDVRPVELISQAGEDTSPANGCRVLISEADESYSVAVAVTDDLAPEVEPGEKEFYSTDNPATQKLARLKFNKDSELELNGNTDFAVRYSELKTGFDQLKTDFNNLITAYNAHIHITTATVGVGLPGVIAVTTSVGSSSTADIDNSKVEEVKLP